MKNVVIKVSERTVYPEGHAKAGLPLIDKGGRKYKTIELRPVGATYKDIPGMGRVAVEGRVRSSWINVFEKSYLDNKPEFGYHEKIGSALLGNVETRQVEPFTFMSKHPTKDEMIERLATQYTTVVLPPNGLEQGDLGYENYVISVFKNRGHIVTSNQVLPTPANAVVDESGALDSPVSSDIKGEVTGKTPGNKAMQA